MRGDKRNGERRKGQESKEYKERRGVEKIN